MDPPVDGGQPLNLAQHVVVAAGVGVVAPFTALAWPFAILVGIVIGQDRVEQRVAIPPDRTKRVVRLPAITGGVLGMLIAGATIWWEKTAAAVRPRSAHLERG